MTDIERKAALLDLLIAKGCFFQNHYHKRIQWAFCEWLELRNIDPRLESELKNLYPKEFKS